MFYVPTALIHSTSFLLRAWELNISIAREYCGKIHALRKRQSICEIPFTAPTVERIISRRLRGWLTIHDPPHPRVVITTNTVTTSWIWLLAVAINFAANSPVEAEKESHEQTCFLWRIGREILPGTPFFDGTFVQKEFTRFLTIYKEWNHWGTVLRVDISMLLVQCIRVFALRRGEILCFRGWLSWLWTGPVITLFRLRRSIIILLTNLNRQI